MGFDQPDIRKSLYPRCATVRRDFVAKCDRDGESEVCHLMHRDFVGASDWPETGNLCITGCAKISSQNVTGLRRGNFCIGGVSPHTQRFRCSK